MKDQPPTQHALCPSCHAAGVLAQPCHERVCALRGYHFVPRASLDGHSSEAPLDPFIGQLLGEYLLVSLIGAGGFGRVYKALQPPFMRPVAVKVLDTDSGATDFAQLKLSKFEVEAQALSRLSHPNIVRFYCYSQHRGVPYIAMELVENAMNLWGEIEQRAHDKQAFRLDEIETVLMQILAALEAAHAIGMIHRDIKPENIMLQRVPGHGLFVKVLDFGLAKFTEDRSATSMLLGTPAYMAHEQLTRGALGPWTDLYALAVLSFELLTGHRPYPGSSVQETLSHKLDQNYDPWSRVSHLNLPHELRTFFTRALERDPNGRYHDVQEMRQALERTFQSLRERKGSEYVVEIDRLLAPTELHPAPRVTSAPPTRTRQHPRPSSEPTQATPRPALTSTQTTPEASVSSVKSIIIPPQLRADTSSQPIQQDIEPDLSPSRAKFAWLGLVVLGLAGAGTYLAFNKGDATLLPASPLTPLVSTRIEPLSYTRGSHPDDPNHRIDERQGLVTLTHALGVTSGEITQQQWLDAFGHNPSTFKSCGLNCPVESISWWDTLAYANLRSERDGLEACYVLTGCQGEPGRADFTCKDVTFKGLSCSGWRLPTEAEWEGFAQALAATPLTAEALSPLSWHQGNSDVTYSGAVTCIDGDPTRRCGPHPIRQLKDNGVGLYDLLGNVREWVFDGYDPYPEGDSVNPVGSQHAAERIIRGGSFNSPLSLLRSAARDHALSTVRAPDLGFRLVRTLTE